MSQVKVQTNAENLRKLLDNFHKCRTKTVETSIVENQSLGLVVQSAFKLIQD